MHLLKRSLTSNGLVANSVFIFIIRFFPSVANLLVLLYYSHRLDKSTYGTYQNFWIQFNVLYPLACFGIHTAISTYSVATILKLAKGVSRAQYSLYFLWLVVLSTVFAWLQMPAGIGFVIPFVFMLVFSAGIIVESFLIVSKKFGFLSFINIAYAAAYLYAHKYILDKGFSFHDLFMLLLAINFTKLLASIVAMVAHIRSHKEEGHEEFRTIPEMRRLWIHLGLYDVLQTVSNWIDKFAISLLLTSSLSAIYFNGSQNIPFLPIIFSAAGSSVLMQMNKTGEKDERASLLELQNKSTRFLSNIVFPLFFFLIFFHYELFAALLPDYTASVPIFFVSLFVLPLRSYSFLTVFQKLHKAHLSNIGAIGELILACLLMYPLYLWMGLPGVMLAFIISSYSQALFYFYHLSRLLHCRPYRLVPVANLTVKVIAYGLIFWLTHYIVISLPGKWTGLSIGIGIMMATMAVSMFIDTIRVKNGNAAKA